MAATTMAMAGSAATASLSLRESAPASSLSSSSAIGNRVAFRGAARQQRQRVAHRMTVKAAKELHFNKDGSAIKRMQVRGLEFLSASHCLGLCMVSHIFPLFVEFRHSLFTMAWVMNHSYIAASSVFLVAVGRLELTSSRTSLA